MIRKKVGVALLASAAGTGAYVAADEKRRIKAQRLVAASSRITNLVVTVGSIVIDYGWTISQRKDKDLDNKLDQLTAKLEQLQNEQVSNGNIFYSSKDPESVERSRQRIADMRNKIDEVSNEIAECREKQEAVSYLNQAHTRSAIKLRDMCAQNQGLYIKLGQHIAMLDYLIPQEYQKALSTLLANAPRSKWDSVRRVLTEDLGCDPESVFESIEKEPIASASLAQVHVAIGKDGKKYAVKVQHEGLYEESQGDMMAITYIVSLISRIFEGFNYNWLSKEMNRNLPLELDFRVEASNLKRCTKLLENLTKTGEVAMPTTRDDLSSTRVLTMSFEEGSYVTDVRAIRDMKLDSNAVAKVISKIFCEQMYRHGFVHCDPHDGNLLVRPNPQNPKQPQIVLLDHGLYRELEPDFRKAYCRLWQALVLADESGIKENCMKMNAGKLYTLLAAMLTMRPWDDIIVKDGSKMKSTTSKADAEMLKAYARKYFKEVVGLLGIVPSDLLLLFKTNDCLRHLDRQLNAPVNSTVVIAETVADVIIREEMSSVLSSPQLTTQNLKTFSVAAYNWMSLRIRGLGLQLVGIFMADSSQLPSKTKSADEVGMETSNEDSPADTKSARDPRSSGEFECPMITFARKYQLYVKSAFPSSV